MEHKVYEGEITFLPSTDKDNNPRDGTRCRSGYVFRYMLPSLVRGCRNNRHSVFLILEKIIKSGQILVSSFKISIECAVVTLTFKFYTVCSSFIFYLQIQPLVILWN